MIGMIATKHLGIALAVSLAALAGSGWMLKKAIESRAEARAAVVEERAKNTDLRTHIGKLAEVRAEEARKLAQARQMTEELNEQRRREMAARRLERERIKEQILASVGPGECMRRPYPVGVLDGLRVLTDAANGDRGSSEAADSRGALNID